MGELDLDRFGAREGDLDEIVEVAATDVWAPSGKEPMIAAINSPEGRLTVRCESIASNEVIRHVEWKDRQYRVPLLPSAALQAYP